MLSGTFDSRLFLRRYRIFRAANGRWFLLDREQPTTTYTSAPSFGRIIEKYDIARKERIDGTL